MEQEKKKRGRKPKGGKIIKGEIKKKEETKISHAVILHLKCNKLEYKSSNNISSLNDINENNEKDNYHYLNKNDNSKSIYEKIEQTNVNFKNNMTSTTSCCFWCTEPFNTCPVYIPSKISKTSIDVYGHFCSPECATAFLFNEKIDTSIKWERYSFINNIYNKDYKKVINPAPSPYYVLDKYYGSLSIEEYRKIIDFNELIIINKPITKITPELYISSDKNNKI